MSPALARMVWRLKRGALAMADTVVAAITLGLMRFVRLGDPDKTSNALGWLARKIGPYLPVSRIGRGNIRAAFPNKSAAEVEAILAGCWENLGRVAGEFAHLDRLWDFRRDQPSSGRITTQSIDLYDRLRDDGKPALVFAAHLANWELAAVGAHAHGLKTTVLYRAPNNLKIAQAIQSTRQNSMGELLASGPDAVLTMAGVLERRGHLAMLVDQHFTRGVPVTFFGRRCMANPTLARLARHYPDVPIHGVRMVRQPGNRFFGEITEAITLPRDDKGDIDVQASMQLVTSIIEGWIREYPEQWLWLHRRWR